MPDTPYTSISGTPTGPMIGDSTFHSILERMVGSAAAFITKDRPIKSIQIYGMLRGKEGEAWFDDITVSRGKHAACACRERQMFEPTENGDCEQCLAGMRCFLGDVFDLSVQSVVL